LAEIKSNHLDYMICAATYLCSNSEKRDCESIDLWTNRNTRINECIEVFIAIAAKNNNNS